VRDNDHWISDSAAVVYEFTLLMATARIERVGLSMDREHPSKVTGRVKYTGQLP
jgi:hypothetical protein